MSESDFRRPTPPPSSTEAEMALVSAMLMAPDCIPFVLKELGAPKEAEEKFMDRRNWVIYSAAVEVRSAGRKVDYISVESSLGETGLSLAGGSAHILECIEAMPDPSSAVEYAGIIQRKWLERRRLRLGMEIVGMCGAVDEKGRLKDYIAETDAVIRDGLIMRAGGPRKTPKEYLNEVYTEWMTRIKGGSLLGLPSHLKALDAMTGGFVRGNLYIVGGRPGMGKTSLVLQFCDSVAGTGKRVCFVSLEMSGAELMGRILFQRTGLNGSQVRVNPKLIKPEEWKDIAEEIDDIVNRCPGWVVEDAPGATVDEVCALIEAAHMESPLDLAAVDYLQLLGGMSEDNMVVAVTQACAKLKNLARRLNIPIILVSQLNREVDKRKEDKRPRMSDLRESGGIEQNADVVMFCYRESYYDKNMDEKCRDISEAIIAKNRFGPCGTCYVYFDGPSTTFYEDGRSFAEWVSEKGPNAYPKNMDDDKLVAMGLIDSSGKMLAPVLRGKKSRAWTGRKPEISHDDFEG